VNRKGWVRGANKMPVQKLVTVYFSISSTLNRKRIWEFFRKEATEGLSDIGKDEIMCIKSM
jgi:hypothetical protein